jgi:hypothetical protein
MMSTLRVLEELKDIYLSGGGRTAMHARLMDIADDDTRVLMTLAGIGAATKTNAGIILAYAVKAPENWINMITGPDVDILIG